MLRHSRSMLRHEIFGKDLSDMDKNTGNRNLKHVIFVFCDGWTMNDCTMMIESIALQLLFLTDQGPRLHLVATRKNGQSGRNKQL